MKKFTTADRLRQIMAERHLRQVDIIDLVKPYSEKYNERLEKSDLSQYLSGKAKPKQRKLTLLASALNVSETWLMGYDDPNIRATTDFHSPARSFLYPGSEDKDCVTMPILGRISAGYDSTAIEEESGEYINLPRDLFKGKSPEDLFVLRVSGDSMYPEIRDRDLIVVHRVPSVESGSLAVIVYNSDDATLKRVNYIPNQDWIELIPINPQFPPKRITGSALEQCKVLGSLKYLIREY